MEKKQKKNKNGMEFDHSIEREQGERKKFSFNSFLFQLITLYLVVYGALFSLINTFDIEIRTSWVISSVLLFGVIFYVIFYFRKYTIWLMLAALLLLGTGFYEYFDQLKEGFYLLENIIIDNLNRYYRTDIPYFVAKQENMVYLLTIFFIAVSAVYTFILQTIILSFRSKWAYFLFVIPFVAVSMAVGLVPSAVPFLCLGIGSIGVLMTLSGKRSRKKEETGYPEHELSVKVGTVLMLSALVITGVTILVYPNQRYREEIDFSKERVFIQNKIVELSRANPVQSLADINYSFLTEGTASGGVNGGKLGRNGEIVYRNTTDLEVTAPDHSKKIYLKGFVGSVYRKNYWEDLSGNEKREFDRLNKELVAKGFYLENQTSDFITYFENGINLGFLNGSYLKDENLKELFESLEGDGNEPRYIRDDIVVTNLNANNDYHYIPYNGYHRINSENGKIIFDGINSDTDAYFVLNRFNYDSENKTRAVRRVSDFLDYERLYYVAPFYKNEGVSDAGALINWLIPEPDPNFQEFLELEKTYRKFVYDVYTDIPEGSSPRALEEFGEFKQKERLNIKVSSYWPSDELETPTLENIVYSIRQYMMTKTKYSLAPGSLPRGEDFIDNFLFDSLKGYCTHYASTATILLRSLGVPARYVEGYVVSESDFEKETSVASAVWVNEDIEYNQVKMQITDKNAHAWVEVYFDRFGWVPIDFTPGYLDSNVRVTNQNETEEEEKETPEEEEKPEEEKEEQKEEEKPEEKEEDTDKNTNEDKGADKKEEIPKDTEKLLFQKTAFRVGILAVFMILLILAFILLRHIYFVKQYNKNISDKNIRKRIIYLYGRMKKLFHYYNIAEVEDQSYDDFINEVESKIQVLHSGEFLEVFQIILAARFGNGQTERDEYRKVKVFYKKIKKDIYKNDGTGNKIKQIYYKYIKSY